MTPDHIVDATTMVPAPRWIVYARAHDGFPVALDTALDWEHLRAVCERRLLPGPWETIRCSNVQTAERIAAWLNAQLGEANAEPDPLVDAVRAKYRARSDAGKEKYTQNLMRRDLDFLAWLNHLQQELMDATLSAERLIHDETRLMDDGK